MKHKTALLTAAVILFGSCLFGCANESCSDTPENIEAQAYSLSSTNLDGISVYSSISSVSYKATDEPQELEPNELLVFIKGSLAPSGSAFMIEDKVYVSLAAAIGMLSLDSAPDYDKSQEYTINDTAFLPLDIIADTLSCSICLCDGENSGENRMIKSCPHIVIERYPENSAKKTKEEALAHLKEQLVTAYEEKYGSFTPLDEKAGGAYDEQEDLRYRISNLSVKGENGRFYVIECVYEFYVDKYTDDIFVHYEGMDESFWRFDPHEEGALSFAG